MLTVSERDEDLFEAIRAGANGYLLKNVGATELLDGIQRVHAGEAMLAPPMAARLLEEFRTLPVSAVQEPEAASVEALSERELDVLRLVAQGLANKEIADALGLSEHTIKTHLQNILDKLQLRSRAHAAAYAVQAGVVKTVHPKR
jgi:DNA-binding NarL/FixJ family response regulator